MEAGIINRDGVDEVGMETQPSVGDQTIVKRSTIIPREAILVQSRY
jgi:hypothetical protein